MEYYIQEDHKTMGPYDLVSIVRKIRNREVGRDTRVATSWQGEDQAAGSIPELTAIFDEIAREEPEEESERRYPSLAFSTLMKSGFECLMQNVSLSVLAGLTLLLAAGGALLFSGIMPGMFSIPLGIVWCALMLALYQAVVLRKSRMQLLTLSFFRLVFKNSFVSLLLCSGIVGLLVFFPAFALFPALQEQAFILVLVPGSFLLLLFWFAPLLVVDRGMGALPALGYSLRVVLRIGGDNFAVLYLLVLTNFILGVFILPILITLPITFSALSEAYDTFFNEYA